VSTTGVGGLTLGAGSAGSCRSTEWRFDNLLSVEMVLADGRVVRASPDEHSDLFWAVRGGGGNFGVASSFEFRLHEVGPLVTGGLVAWPVGRARDWLRLFRDLAAEAPDDQMLAAALITDPMPRQSSSRFWRATSATAMRPKRRSSRSSHSTSRQWTRWDRFPMRSSSHARRVVPAGCPQLLEVRISARSSPTTRLTRSSRASCGCPSPMGQIVIENFHGAATRVPPTDTAYALRASGFNVLVLSQWMDAAGDAKGSAWARDSYAALAPSSGQAATSTIWTRMTSATVSWRQPTARTSSVSSRSRRNLTRKRLSTST
jgi:hypothetical protein